MAWTEEQQRAIDARDCDMLVSAAAGSGKTAVLVERIIQLVRGGADIGRMLIVTFTNAVAAEMRERLSAKFDELAADNDAHMREQAQACRQAHIQTLHSFCRDICRAYFLAADVDPGFRILDQQEAQLIQERALDSAMLAEFEKVDEDLATLNALRGPDALREMVMALYRFLCSRADGPEWLADMCSPGMRANQIDAVKRHIASTMSNVRRSLTGALRMADGSDACVYSDALGRDIGEWPDGSDMAQLIAFRPARFAAKKGAPKGVGDLPESVRVKNIRDTAKKRTAEMQLMAELIADDLGAEYDYLDRALPALAKLEKAFEREYTQRKRERGGLDFNDLEHRALQALKYPYVEQSVRAMFDYVFVDEYQDISLIQDSIISRVAVPRSLFMVGDIKQSIYRFRQADPMIFLDKYMRYSPETGGDTLRIDLNKNFRSRANVLAYVNGIFGRVMQSVDYEIDYDENAALKPGLPVQPDDPAVEIHLLGDREQTAEEAETDESDTGDELEELSREESEARVAAEAIKRLVGREMLDQKTGTVRKIEYRDIVVLSRNVKNIAPRALEVLLGEGISAYADATGGYFDMMEVRQVLQLLRVIDNRLRDYELLGVLHSPMFGFTANDLAGIRVYTPRGSFADALETYAVGRQAMAELHANDAGAYAEEAAQENDNLPPEYADTAETAPDEAYDSPDERDPALLERVRSFINKLDEWQRSARFTTLTELVWQLMDETGYYVYVGALPDGMARQANLRLLGERAASYEDSQFGGLHGFIKYVEQLKSSSQDMTTASTLGEGDNVVRIMSVHKSKGLEFPVVIGINLGVKFKSSARSDLALHGDIGAGMYRMDEVKSARYNTVARMAVSIRQQQEQLAEEMRILYVLLTRARDRLVLIGSVRGDIDARIQDWDNDISFKPESMLDWIMPASLIMEQNAQEAGVTITTHDARGTAVTSEEPDLSEKLAQLRAEPVDAAMYSAMTWRYPFENAVLAPLKLTASQLGREVEGMAAVPECRERPQFLSESDMNALEKGVATHTVMQWLELSRLRGLEGRALYAEIAAQLDMLNARGTLTLSQREGVRQNMIAGFFDSEIGRRMLESPRVEREWPFNLRMTAGEALLPGEKNVSGCENERILVQGVIDCCFEENGKWVLIDYKTDREDDPEALRERYITQLGLYARALNEITGIEVGQMGLFLLRQRKFLDLTEYMR